MVFADFDSLPNHPATGARVYLTPSLFYGHCLVHMPGSKARNKSKFLGTDKDVASLLRQTIVKGQSKKILNQSGSDNISLRKTFAFPVGLSNGGNVLRFDMHVVVARDTANNFSILTFYPA